MNNSLTDNELIKNILGYCKKEKSFIFITGTGCSGKTTLSLKMVAIIEAAGMTANCIHMDDFLTNSVIRKTGIKHWELDGKKFEGRYTSCCEESYYLAAIESVFFALNNNQVQYIKTKNGNFDLIDSNADITIIEGLGVPFIPSISGLKIFLECSEEIAIQRRIIRDSVRLNKSAEEIITDSIDRRNQYQKYVMPFMNCCELILKSNEDFTFSILSNKIGLI